MLRLMIIIIDYLETALFQSGYAKIDSNYHSLPYPMIIITHAKAEAQKKAPCPAAHPQYSQVWKCPPAQYTVGYGDRSKRTPT